MRWQRLMTATLAPYGLTHVQFVLLASTWWLTDHGGPPRQRDVADHAGTDPMVTSPGVRALEGRGLRTRAPDPDDARARRLEPTKRGRTLALEAIQAVDSADRAYFEGIPADTKPAVLAALRSLADR